MYIILYIIYIIPNVTGSWLLLTTWLPTWPEEHRRRVCGRNAADLMPGPTCLDPSEKTSMCRRFPSNVWLPEGISPLYHYCFWLYPMKITVDSYEQIPLAKYSTNGLSYHHDIPIILWFSIAMVNYQRVSHYITIILDTLPIELVIFHTHGFISPLCSHHHTYSNDIPIVSPLYIYICPLYSYDIPL